MQVKSFLVCLLRPMGAPLISVTLMSQGKSPTTSKSSWDQQVLKENHAFFFFKQGASVQGCFNSPTPSHPRFNISTVGGNCRKACPTVTLSTHTASQKASPRATFHKP